MDFKQTTRVEYSDEAKALIEEAAERIAADSSQSGIAFYGREIPTEAFLLVLLDEPLVAQHLETNQINVAKLRQLVEEDFREVIFGEGVPNGDRPTTKEMVLRRSTPDKNASWVFKNSTVSKGFNPVHCFGYLMLDKTAPTSYRSDYQNVMNGSGKGRSEERFDID